MPTQTETETVTDALTTAIGTLGLRGATHPLERNHSLDQWSSFQVTPTIGHEFSKGLQLSELVHSAESDKFIADLAVLISQRGVVFFRGQDLNIEDQKTLGIKLGQLSGKPADSSLHIHPLTEVSSSKGDHISIITSERRAQRPDETRFASKGWHSDITFEPVPSDYAILKVHTNADSGGDTLWASAYEAYSRLSPDLAKFLESHEAYHEAKFFGYAAKQYGNDLRKEERGSPLNTGDGLEAIHPVVRVNPVTGWKGLFVNRGFTKRILGVSKDESDHLLEYLLKLYTNNHDLQVRFKWSTNNAPGIGDIAIWDNRSTVHTATFDYENALRVGDRVVSIGEKPYFDPAGRERREALGLPENHQGTLGEHLREGLKV